MGDDNLSSILGSNPMRQDLGMFNSRHRDTVGGIAPADGQYRLPRLSGDAFNPNDSQFNHEAHLTLGTPQRVDSSNEVGK